LDAGSREGYPVRVRIDPTVPAGSHLVAIDVTLDGHRYGQRFDMVIGVEP
jgi:hypothetical protein